MLGALAEGATHGFALARLLGPGGPLGQIWTLPRPVVYQALNKLSDRGLVAPQATERSERGPNRTIVAVTPAGRRALERWLATPVEHVRDMRSELLLKLALLDRAGTDRAATVRTRLIDAQRATLDARLQALRTQEQAGEGFERLLGAWRAASVRAVLEFLSAASPVTPPTAASRR